MPQLETLDPEHEQRQDGWHRQQRALRRVQELAPGRRDYDRPAQREKQRRELQRCSCRSQVEPTPTQTHDQASQAFRE